MSDERQIEPASSLRGDVRVPGDKSTSHRALMISALASGTSTIEGLSSGEDVASTRREELNNISALIESIGKKLGYKIRKKDKLLFWEEDGQPARSFCVLASALISRALDIARPDTILVVPGGRAALVTYKQEGDPALAARLKNYRVVKYRLLRAISEVSILTRDSFDAQIISDPVEQSTGQMMMF